MLETCDGFVSEGDNPYFVLEPGFKLILEGKEKRKDVKLVTKNKSVLNYKRAEAGVEGVLPFLCTFLTEIVYFKRYL